MGPSAGVIWTWRRFGRTEFLLRGAVRATWLLGHRVYVKWLGIVRLLVNTRKVL